MRAPSVDAKVIRNIYGKAEGIVAAFAAAKVKRRGLTFFTAYVKTYCKSAVRLLLCDYFGQKLQSLIVFYVKLPAFRFFIVRNAVALVVVRKPRHLHVFIIVCVKSSYGHRKAVHIVWLIPRAMDIRRYKRERYAVFRRFFRQFYGISARHITIF